MWGKRTAHDSLRDTPSQMPLIQGTTTRPYCLPRSVTAPEFLALPENRRLSGLSFENRLSLVLEKGTDTWKRTMQLYSVRNQIAHGTLLSERIDVSSVIQDFCVIQSSLARP